MDFTEELRHLADSPVLDGNGKLAFIREIPERNGVFQIPRDSFYREVTKSIFPKGLYKHQINALDLIDQGSNVAIATSTSSGKSLCYQLPVAKAILSSKKRSQRPKALVIHPTKALAQDQIKSWSKLRLPGVLVSTFDGDSSSEQRLNTKRYADVWLTNPEMVNSAILANHGQYHALLSGLDFVVIDEAHVYRGIFGSHVANLMRRLVRIARIYGADPQFVFTSGTIANAAQICSTLINQAVVVIEEDFSPQAAKTVAVWMPALLDADTGTRSSYSRAAAIISSHLAAKQHKVITFVRSRRLSEVIANEARELLASVDEFDVLSYRGGYLPGQRRSIEQLVAEGKTRLLVSTSAMELGLDLGHLDAAVIAGFPGTFSSFRQQIGRVGRSGNHSAAILVCCPDALDQWIGANPDSIISRGFERAIINPSNQHILKEHLRAASFESPLLPSELAQFAGPSPGSSDAVKKVINELQAEGQITFRSGVYATNIQNPPHRSLSMRSSGSRQVMISAEDGELLGTI